MIFENDFETLDGFDQKWCFKNLDGIEIKYPSISFCLLYHLFKLEKIDIKNFTIRSLT